MYYFVGCTKTNGRITNWSEEVHRHKIRRDYSQYLIAVYEYNRI